MSNATEIRFPRFTLVSISNPSGAALDELAQRWSLHPRDLQETAGISRRTRLEIYPEHLCLITLWPTYRRTSKDIRAAELSFFIRPDALVIVARGSLPVYTELVHRYAESRELRNTIGDRQPERLLHEILRQLYQSLLPMVDHLIDDCDRIEQEIFDDCERRLIHHILAIRRNITDVRKILQVHKNVLKRLVIVLTERPQYALQSNDRYFNGVIDNAREVWDTLENLKERIETLQQTNESQISLRLSEIMKTLTIISVFTFPLTLVAALFSIRQIEGMPFLGQPGNFWYVIGIEGAIAIVMLIFFKRKRWF
ncbi:MAG: magnesium transporter CorA family protein [Patescibacteria group bacterium]|nr:magnesium transporter CorA family protein [Patescibacteria group bacterium]